MKKLFTTLLTFSSLLLFGQVPQGFSYQAVAFNSAGSPVVSSTVSVRISVLDNSASGTTLYTETHSKTTNASGLYSLTIGQGTPTLGTFTSINWSVNSKFVKVELDPTGGTTYTTVGTSQFLSVPFALVADTVLKPSLTNSFKGVPVVYFTDSISDSMANEIVKKEIGEHTREIYIMGCTRLTTLNINSNLPFLSIQCNHNPKLINLTLGNVKYINVMNINTNPELKSLNLPNVVSCYSLGISTCNKLELVDFSKLQNTTGNITFQTTNLKTLAFNSLVNSYSIAILNNDSLNSISLPKLANIKYLELYRNKINTVNISSIKSNMLGFDISYNKLSSTIINRLANQFVNTTPPFSNTIFKFKNQTPPAPPTGQGINDIQTLDVNNFVEVD